MKIRNEKRYTNAGSTRSPEACRIRPSLDQVATGFMSVTWFKIVPWSRGCTWGGGTMLAIHRWQIGSQSSRAEKQTCFSWIKLQNPGTRAVSSTTWEIFIQLFMNWVKVWQQLPHVDHNTTQQVHPTTRPTHPTPKTGNGGNGIGIIGGTASDHWA